MRAALGALDVVAEGPPAPPSVAYIHAPELTFGPGDRTSTVTAKVDFLGASVDVWYRFVGIVPEPAADAFVTSMLLPAMLHGLAVVSEAPVSPRLLGQLPVIQDIYATWVPALQKVPITASFADPAGEAGGGTAAFFTGGMDSFYTLLTHQAEIETLIFAHAFPAPLSAERRAAASRTVQRVAAAFGVHLIEVESNFASLLEDWFEVGRRGHLSPTMLNFELAHGAAMAAIAHLLPRTIGRVYIAAGSTYKHLEPWGSHPLLDPMWSTEKRSFVHDGAAATRIQKAHTVAGSDVALQTLRVCQEGGTRTGLNCGRCEKCLRTMVNLRIAGALDRCTVFAERLDLARLSLAHTSFVDEFYEQNLNAARALGTDPELVAALERARERRSPGRLALRFLFVCWQVTKRVLPVRRVDGRIRWGKPL